MGARAGANYFRIIFYGVVIVQHKQHPVEASYPAPYWQAGYHHAEPPQLAPQYYPMPPTMMHPHPPPMPSYGIMSHAPPSSLGPRYSMYSRPNGYVHIGRSADLLPPPAPLPWPTGPSRDGGYGAVTDDTMSKYYSEKLRSWDSKHSATSATLASHAT